MTIVLLIIVIVLLVELLSKKAEEPTKFEEFGENDIHDEEYLNEEGKPLGI